MCTALVVLVLRLHTPDLPRVLRLSASRDLCLCGRSAAVVRVAQGLGRDPRICQEWFLIIIWDFTREGRKEIEMK